MNAPIPPFEIGLDAAPLLEIGEGAVGTPGGESFMTRVQAWAESAGEWSAMAWCATAPLWAPLGLALALEIRETFGRGQPVNEDDLDEFEPAFDAILRTLDEAKPKNWTGSLAESYTFWVDEQIAYVDNVREVDNGVFSEVLHQTAALIDEYHFTWECLVLSGVGAIILVAAMVQFSMACAFCLGLLLGGILFGNVLALMFRQDGDYAKKCGPKSAESIKRYKKIAELANKIGSGDPVSASMGPGFSDVFVTSSTPRLVNTIGRDGPGNGSPAERDTPWAASVSPSTAATPGDRSPFFEQPTTPSITLPPTVVGQVAWPVQQRTATANRANDPGEMATAGQDVHDKDTADGAAGAATTQRAPVEVVTAGAGQKSPYITEETHAGFVLSS